MRRAGVARLVVRAALRLLQSLVVRLGNRGRGTPRLLRTFTVANLLTASRIAARLSDGDTVLDVGCGSGHLLAELRLYRHIRAVGVDVALARAAFPDVEVFRFDGWTLPFPDGAFDVTVLAYVLHHLTPAHAGALLAEAIRVTRRRILLREDTLPEFDRWYRLRNRLHRLEAGLQYAGESATHAPVRDEAMFLTHDGWQRFLGRLERVVAVEIEPLDRFTRYRHHALIDVALAPPLAEDRSSQRGSFEPPPPRVAP